MKIVSVHHIGITGNMDATAIAEHLRKGDFSVEEKMHAANPHINAVVAYNFELNKYSYKKGEKFSGMPLFVKDLIHAKGFPTKYGSLAISDKQPVCY